MGSLRLRIALSCACLLAGLASADQAPSGLSVTFYNQRSFACDLYWSDVSSDESALMGQVPAGSELLVNTFEGHAFFFAVVGSREPLKMFHVTPELEQGYTLSEDDELDLDPTELAELLRPLTGGPPNTLLPQRTLEELVALKREEKKANAIAIEQFSRAVPVKFRNLSGKSIELWYSSGGAGTKQGIMQPGGDSTTNSYPGHVFCIVEHKDAAGCNHALERFSMTPETYTYVYNDGSGSRDAVAKYEAERAFGEEYRNRTGRHWISYYPRPAPVLFMWRADRVGQTFVVETPHGHFSCLPDGEPNSWSKQALEKCAPPPTPDPSIALPSFTLRALTVPPSGPRAFVIENLLSESEVAHLVQIGSPKVSRSLTGQADSAFESSTRTSKNTWVKRSQSPIIETIYRRAADVLNIDHELLRESRNAEPLQLVHYDPGEKYDAHFDWSVEKGGPTRFITLLLYLNDPSLGGETAFPKTASVGIDPAHPLAASPADAEAASPTVVHPGAGSAVLFYNLLEDGNADDLSMHAALPVAVGEKWLANFWIWDPIKKT